MITLQQILLLNKIHIVVFPLFFPEALHWKLFKLNIWLCLSNDENEKYWRSVKGNNFKISSVIIKVELDRISTLTGVRLQYDEEQLIESNNQ